jgi:cytochrome c oxidase subunit 2
MQLYAGIVFVVMAAVLAAVFVYVAREAQVETYETVRQRGALIRRWWFRGLLGAGLIAFAGSLAWLPYQRARPPGGEATAVRVTARQFVFDASVGCVPADRPVELAVGADDVTHGVGVYGPDGRIVGQVQAMPGFTNVLRLRLDPEGEYTLRCLELCGPGHHGWAKTMKVGGCG